MKQGDLVRYNHKWCSEGERKLTFVILEEHDHRNDGYNGKLQFLIQCTTPLSEGSIFYSTEVVDDYMIETV